MGCDIHLFIEYVTEFGGHLWSGGEVNNPRNSALFEAIAGVGSDEPPLVSPRGLPPDLDDAIFERYYRVVAGPNDQVPSYYKTVTPSNAEALLASRKSHDPPLIVSGRKRCLISGSSPIPNGTLRDGSGAKKSRKWSPDLHRRLLTHTSLCLMSFDPSRSTL